MDLREARNMTIDLMTEHGLLDRGWSFAYNRKKNRAGECDYLSREIRLSSVLTAHRPTPEVRNTILHEVAHAIVGHGNGHNWVWRQMFVQLGGNGERCFESGVREKVAKYRVECEAGGETLLHIHRLTKNYKYGYYRCREHHSKLRIVTLY